MMKKRNLVIVDYDLQYVRQMEETLIPKLADRIDIHIITDEAYKEIYFSAHREIDLLMIDFANYGEYLKEHYIKKTFLMLPEIVFGIDVEEGVQVMMKYIPEKDILAAIIDAYNKIEAGLLMEEGEGVKDTKIISVYSPIGGCGKSLVSIGLCKKLTKLDQQVLLVGCDNMQSFAAFFHDQAYAEEELAAKLIYGADDTYWTIQDNIKEEDDFSYLRPFQKFPRELGLNMTHWANMLSLIKRKHSYDYIVLDIGSPMDEDIKDLLDISDEILMITEPNIISARKMNKLLLNNQMLPKTQCLIISNQYHYDGLRIAPDAVFDVLGRYDYWEEALEDPIFYRLALEYTE